MNAEIHTFIECLFRRCRKGTNDAFLTLSAIHPDGTRPTPSCHVPLGDEARLQSALQRLLRANAWGWGAYLGVATRTANLGRWARGGKDHLGELPALFVDIDDPGCALWQLTFFELPPSVIVHSGRGYHAYWLLNPPTREFVAADKLLKELADRLGGDPALSVAQSMRLPGTINTKADRDGATCSIVRLDAGNEYTLTEFVRWLPPPRPVHWHRQWHGEMPSYETEPAVIEAVTEAVLHDLDGRPRHNGFIAARCPLPHAVDRPGMHFSYHPGSGVGFCFGKHGKVPLPEMRKLMGVWG